MDLNSRIQKIIEYSQLSSSEFADEIGVQRSNISHIISGRNKPSLDFIIKIKDRFPEIQWEWIIEGKGNMTTDDETSSIQFTNIQESKINLENTSTPLFPDLFSTITKEMEHTDSIIEKEENNISNQPESTISPPKIEQDKIDNSQQLENEETLPTIESIDNKYDKIKKIVFFYENGKFEIFEP